MMSLPKKYFLSFHSPIFHSKIHKRRVMFFQRGGGNSLKRRYVEGWGIHVNEQGRTRGEGGVSTIRNFERTYFLNVPVPRGHIQHKKPFSVANLEFNQFSELHHSENISSKRKYLKFRSKPSKIISKSEAYNMNTQTT